MSEEIQMQCEVEEGAPLWVVTFGDLMSLLLCFFVLMLSFSEQDRKKYRMVSGSMNRAFGIQRNKPVFESPKGQKIIAREFDQAILIAKIEHEFMDPVERETLNRIGNAKELFEIEASEDKVTIRLMGETTFDLGSADIRPAFKSLLLKVGTLLAFSPCASAETLVFKEFGSGFKSDKSRENYIWSDNKADRMLEYINSNDYGMLWMRSRKLDRQYNIAKLKRPASYLKHAKKNSY